MPDDLIVDSCAPPGVRNYPRSLSHPALARRVALALALGAVGAGLLVLYVCQSRTAPFNSDGAANVLQAQSMIDGNPLLRGWWTSDVSFYSTELPEYALVEAIRGVSPDVVHLCGALSYTLTIALAALVASGGAGWRARDVGRRARVDGWRAGDAVRPGGRGAAWCRAAVAVAIMIAPSLLGGTEVFLENPDHAGTAVPVLAVLLLLDRAADRRYLPWAVAALLTLAQLGDELTLAAATVPLALVCAARLVGQRRLATRRGLVTQRRLPGGAARRDGSLLVAAAASVVLARLAGWAVRALGGFDLRPLGGLAPAPLRDVPANARMLWQSLVLLFGANQPGPPHQPRAIEAHQLLVALADLHLTGLVLAAAGLAAGITAVAAGRADRVTAVLVTAVVLVAAAGLFTTVLRSLSNAHEVAVLLPLGAALAARALPAWRWPAAAGWRRGGRLALGCWLAAGVAGLGYAASWPAAVPAPQPVAAWLASQHQHAGLAGYWQATATTVTSGGQLLVAPIVISASGPGGATAPRADRWESSAAWYQPGQHTATFVIAVTNPAAPGGGLPAALVRARFGPPALQHQIGPDVIMLYRYNLLTRLAGTSFPGPG